MEFDNLKGETLAKIEQIADERVVFTLSDGRRFCMFHKEDCCESVGIEDVVGDYRDLIGEPLTMAEETTNHDNPKYNGEESFTWTFYRLATVRGYVTIRWYGSSNGWYSESVDFEEIERVVLSSHELAELYTQVRT